MDEVERLRQHVKELQDLLSKAREATIAERERADSLQQRLDEIARIVEQ